MSLHTTRFTLLAMLLCLILLLLFASPVRSQWIDGGIVICNDPEEQHQLSVAPDGVGGMLMVWTDDRSGDWRDSYIYAQRVSADGFEMWPGSDGLAIRTGTTDAAEPSICPDGSGGAWVVWRDDRDTRSLIYGAHVNMAGAIVWGAGNGSPITTDTSYYNSVPVCDTDGAGGVVIAWKRAIGMAEEVMAQRLNSSGTPLWGSAALLAGDYTNGNDLQILGNTDNGAFLVWNRGLEILAQRISSGGSKLWDPAGVSPWGEPTNDTQPDACLDGTGGILIAWRGRDVIDLDYHIYAQRIDQDGNSLYYANPFPPGPAVLWSSEFDDLDGYEPVIASNGSGGAVVAWEVDGSSGATAIYGQRLGGTGAKLWGPDPVQVSADDTNQNTPHIAAHGDEAVIVWTGFTSGLAQRMSSTGTRLWGSSFADVPIPAPSQMDIVAGSGGQTLMGWVTEFATEDIYATSLEGDGDPTGPNLVVTNVYYTVNPQQAGENVECFFEFENVGSSASGGFRVGWYRDEPSAPLLGDPPEGYHINSGLAPGQSIVQSAGPITSIFAGTWHTYVFADYQGSVSETDETDNIYGPVDMVWVVLPDLEITSFTVSDPNPHNGEQVTATITVRNNGAAPAGPFDIDFYRNLGTPPSVGQAGTFTQGVTNLTAGADTTWTTDPYTLTSNALLVEQCYAQVDTQDDVPESDEANNVAGPETVSWQYGHDVTITSFSLSSTQPEVGEFVTATIEIRNDGYLFLSGVNVDFYQDRATAPGVGDAGDMTHAARGLIAGESDSWTTDPFTWTDGMEQWGCWAQVDAPDDVAEFDEANNVAGPIALTWNTPVQEGWPVTIGGNCYSSPVIAPMATNPPGLRAVLVTSSDGKCYAWDGLGNKLPGWPFDTLNSIRSSPAVGDIDDDGSMDVVFGSDDGKVFCINTDGSIKWIYPAAASVGTTPVLADFFDDGTMETVFVDGDGDLHMLDHVGNRVAGWPISIGATAIASPAVGDINLDGLLEIVAIGLTTKPTGSAVHVLRRDGSSLLGWPVTPLVEIHSSPALGDVLSTDTLEIVVGDVSGYLHVWQVSPLSPSLHVDLGRPILSSPALADLSGHDAGELEIVIATEYLVGNPPFQHLESTLFALNETGSFLTGWPQPIWSGFTNSQACDGPVVWGQGNDSVIAIGSYNGNCYVYNNKGIRLDGMRMPGGGPIRGSLAVGELDADGHLEVVVPGDTGIACYDLLAGSYVPALLQWPMWGHDMWRTRTSGSGTVTSVEDPTTPESIALTRMYPAHPNPFNPSLVIPYALTESGPVEITIYDAAGRQVRRLLAEVRPSGRHDVVWHGRDDAGKSVGSGVYLVKMKSASGEDSQSITLLK